MRAFELDFQRRPRPSPFGWLLLAAGLATLAALAGQRYQLTEATHASQAALALFEAQLPNANAAREAGAADPAAEAALAAARQTLERAKLPWDELFAALEAADNADVALLAVTPDVARGQIKIHADARHLAAMLAFQRRLQQSGALRHVTLLDHEALREAGQPSVRFHLVAAWGADHGRP